MDWIALGKSLGLCLIAVVIEAVSATAEGRRWFESLNQPKRSLPFALWYWVGGIYYLICGTIAYRQFHDSVSAITLPIILLALLMVCNGLSNFLLFKARSLPLFHMALYPFGILLVTLIISLYTDDRLSAALGSVYLIWLFYDVYYFASLQRLNKNNPAK